MAPLLAPGRAASICVPFAPILSGVASETEFCAGIVQENVWREPHRAEAGVGVVVATRWSDDRPCGDADSAPAPGRHEIAVAMKTTRLKLFRDSNTLFEGLMPSGTIYVSDGALPLKIEFHAPCDFIHFSVPNSWLSDAPSAGADPHGLDGFTMRDALAEGLARSLIDVETEYGDLYAQSVGRTIVMRLLGAARARAHAATAKVSPLPRWRLKRVQEYIAANLENSISLPELAGVAGLSRMHFAAQFRAATGYRPHEYLLFRRIEEAKALLHQTMPLVEVALSVGFQSQAHFSTIFKRFTGQTPLSWRRKAVEVPAAGKDMHKPRLIAGTISPI